MAGLGLLHDLLYGGLWHTTRPDRIPSIVAAGALLVEPEIDNSERWKTSRGPNFYPFVRKIGGVSLFDFADFDADSYDQCYRQSNWRSFVPYRECWRGAVWIEVNREAIRESMLSAQEVVQRWKDGGHERHTIMPFIEAAHIGSLPVSAFRSAFLTWDKGREVQEFSVHEFGQKEYARIVSEWEAFKGKGQR